MKAIHQLIEEQVRRWEILKRETREAKPIPVITVSREPGSGGKFVARAVAEQLGLDIFHQEIINAMAENADASTRVIRTLDERGLSMIEDWVSAAISDRHLWPDEVSRVLMQVIGTIGRHGRAVIVGRGANFVLPPENRFRVRIIAPFEMRVNCVAEAYGVSKKEAKRHVLRTESDRQAFIRKYFHSDIADPANYDMVLNAGSLSVESAAAAICSAVG
ncbi:cytidylate kinase [Desulfosarcina alkanivorans]|jgi:cytidylate kinase|uniref:Cytidylate kinase n=1 Tax=Desulfosarcina alkanivorans TaxID=571177 RepID=A0A5K7YQ78_9BACT|nr:cytidylate kinase-like family protein [Desulfosarcina alkanivorans]BBO70520.1 cytidylate kinase [Desulfosarcina alkanivorans]